MKLSQNETKLIRTFVRGQLCDEPDLSTLTIRILKTRYLAHIQGDTLSPEAKSFMKQVVQEELLKMQDNDNSEREVENRKAQKKRKRTNELLSEEEDEFVGKKLRYSASFTESKDNVDSVATAEENKTEGQNHSGSDDKEQLMNVSQRRNKTQDSSEESIDEGEKSVETGKNDDSSLEEVEKSKTSTFKDGDTARKISSHEEETSQSEKDSDGDGGDDESQKSQKIKNNTSSDDSDKEKPSEKKIKDDTDSDSSSLPSLEDEDDKKREHSQEKKKNVGKKPSKEQKKSDKGGQKDEHKSVVRLKRFISLCGVRRNYKKLLHGCRSVRSQVAILKKELEDLGVHGKPSVEKCKKIKMKREEAQELAELDVNNIISTQGRPKRRGASVWQKQQEPPSSTRARVLNSESDSGEENKLNTGCRRTTDWSKLQGIISDDADSD